MSTETPNYMGLAEILHVVPGLGQNWRPVRPPDWDTCSSMFFVCWIHFLGARVVSIVDQTQDSGCGVQEEGVETMLACYNLLYIAAMFVVGPRPLRHRVVFFLRLFLECCLSSADTIGSLLFLLLPPLYAAYFGWGGMGWDVNVHL